MSDRLISEKMAIDAIMGEPTDAHYPSWYAEKIKELPSAEPQIIRCKECKHRDPEDKKCDCGHDIRWQLPRRDDWYCADAERNSEQTLSEADNDTAYGGLMSAT